MSDTTQLEKPIPVGIRTPLDRLCNRPEMPWLLDWLRAMGLRQITIKIDGDTVNISATSGGPPFVTSVDRQISLATLRKEQ